MRVLVLNGGSSSLKFRLFLLTSDGEEVLAEGEEEGSGTQAMLQAAQKVLRTCKPLGIEAIGHRIVHGGSRFSEPVVVTSEVMQGLYTLSELDSLHNPSETALIEAGQHLLPDVPSVAVFDTAFHQTLPEIAWRYALPRALSDPLQLRRYGFHGISYQYVSEKLLVCLGRKREGSRLIVCHLGSGASICALKDGKSVDTSMGLTPLEGLVMGTRCGDLDPGLLLHLLRVSGKTAEQLDDLLNRQSGLKGLSGKSGDVRELENSAQAGDSPSELALELFAYRACKYIGAYAAALEGLDALAFTGGIGEHSAPMRMRICRRLAFLGLSLDTARNEPPASEARCISPESAAVPVWVIPTDEERQIAREVFALLNR